MALRISTGLRDKINGIQTNLLSNGTFASDATGWTLTASAAQDGGSGANSTTGFLKCIADGADPGKASTTTAITVKPYNFYMLEFYVKKTDCNGEVVISTAVSGGGTVIAQSQEYSDTSWTKKYFGFFNNSNSTSLYVTFQGASSSGTDRVDFDELKMYQASASIKDIFNKGFIKIYSGSQPSSPDDAPSGNLLVTIYSDGTSEGLSFDDSSSGVLSKAGSETWSGTATGSGTQTAGWFRLVTSSDGGGSSQIEERIDGSVATSGAQLNMSNNSITNGAVQTVSIFQITMPAS